MDISGADEGIDIEPERPLDGASSDWLEVFEKSNFIADGVDASDALEVEAFCCASWREYSISLSSFSCSFIF